MLVPGHEPTRQFYSRRIGDISWGAKTTGSLGRTDVSAIFTSGDLELDGSQRADYGILRLQQGLPGGSNIGLLAADRRTGGEDLRHYVDEMSRNFELFQRRPGDAERDGDQRSG